MRGSAARSGRIGLVIAFALLVAPAAAAAAAAVPKTELRAGGHSQHGGLVWEEWASRSGRYCVSSGGDGPGTYPRSIHLGPGVHTARFILFRRQKPAEVNITAWHSLDSRGYETGPHQELPYTIRPRRDADGAIKAWRVRFSVDLPPHDYLHLYVGWPDGSCGGPRHLLRTYAIGAG